MSRLNQLFDYLFVNDGSALVLDSGTTGEFQQAGASPFPVFRTPLSSGQILLLFADVVPKALSTQLLSGVPVEFQYDSGSGSVNIHMTLSGDDLRVTATAIKKAPLMLVPTVVNQPAQLGPPPPDGKPRQALQTLMLEMSARRATHLHVVSGGAALLRVDGHLVPVQSTSFSEQELFEALKSLAPPALRESLHQHARVDFSHVSDQAVFHVSAQHSRTGLSLVVRHLPRLVPSVSSLGLPPELVHAMTGTGLWVLAGPPGNGVTTSLASVVQTVVAQRALSVRCLESPIEYVLAPGAGPICQLEVGAHVVSFAEGLRDARHDDVDVVMVSELDDAEVLSEALCLAERGKLVVGSLHARNAAQAAEKLVHLTQGNPASRWQLGQTLRGVFSQVLCRNTEGGRSLAWELLPGVAAVRSAIFEGQTAVFPSLRTRALELGLAELVAAGLLERDEALTIAPDRALLESLLTAPRQVVGRSAA
ncbi:MAG: ATPase, T2SS/T4P/T4SS family [Myxococcales bacterium]|nr:ATPase, T2SS/T4P/T4SS family [Myxococcales bacterium]MDP3505051.1 ATPase, T2SS/T4P/T4SS family [Myxococcales bacterium]